MNDLSKRSTKYRVGRVIFTEEWYADDELMSMSECASELRCSPSRLHHLLCRLRHNVADIRDDVGRRYILRTDLAFIRRHLRGKRRESGKRVNGAVERHK